MAYCQYEETKRATGEPPNLLYEIKCAFCLRHLWIPRGAFPRDWCDVRPDQRPYTKCIHRGKQVGYAPNKLCGNCKGQDEAVFECDKHGKCTMQPLKHNQETQHCLGCFHDKLGFERESENASNRYGS